MKKLPRRLLESFGLVSELSAKRRGTFVAIVEDYERELQTAGRARAYTRNAMRRLEAVGEACEWKQLGQADR